MDISFKFPLSFLTQTDNYPSQHIMPASNPTLSYVRVRFTQSIKLRCSICIFSVTSLLYSALWRKMQVQTKGIDDNRMENDDWNGNQTSIGMMSIE